MPDPFAHMAATLRGTAPPALPSKAEATAARLSRGAAALRETGDPAHAAVARLIRAAAVLRGSGDPELAVVAGAFEQWLASGGDLARLLGVKARRGKRDELPRNVLARKSLGAALRELVANDPKLAANDRAASTALSDTFRRQPWVCVILRAETGVDYVPTSRNGLFMVLRAAK